MTTITASTGSPSTTSPDLVLGYETERTSGNIVHNLIGGGVAVVVAPANPRSGKLSLFYQSESAAFASLTLHSRAAKFTLTGAERGPVNMSYVVSPEGVSIALDDETRSVWVVTVGYQEVAP